MFLLFYSLTFSNFGFKLWLKGNFYWRIVNYICQVDWGGSEVSSENLLKLLKLENFHIVDCHL